MSGEPAGIGPDLCALLAKEKFDANLVILGDKNLIASRAAAHGVNIDALNIEHIAAIISNKIVPQWCRGKFCEA